MALFMDTHSLDGGVKASDVLKKLLDMGMMATINQALDHDTAALIDVDPFHAPQEFWSVARVAGSVWVATSQDLTAGGAGNAANNVAALGVTAAVRVMRDDVLGRIGLVELLTEPVVRPADHAHHRHVQPVEEQHGRLERSAVGGHGREATNSTAAVEYDDPSIANNTFIVRRPTRHQLAT